MTTAFVCGLLVEEIDEIFQVVKSRRTGSASPMFVPTMLSGSTLKYLRHRLSHCHGTSDSIRRKLGLAESVRKPSFREPLIDDSLELSQSLTTLLVKLAKYEQHCEGLIRLYRVLDEASRSCFELTPQSNKVMVEESTASIRTLISYMTCTAESTRDWAGFLDRRTQSCVQTIYSLVAQRDNLVNAKLAESSVRIAEAARADNLAMKTIAEDSRIAAIESLRKSHIMSSIGVVTMLFLPATFIATLFSTSFFDFHSKDGPVVSRWIWLYVVVTVLMTVTVQLLWFLNARNDSRIGKDLGELKGVINQSGADSKPQQHQEPQERAD